MSIKFICDGCAVLSKDPSAFSKIGVGYYCDHCLDRDKNQLPKPSDVWAEQICREIDESVLKDLRKPMNDHVEELLKKYDHEMFNLGVDPIQCKNYCGEIGAAGLQDDSIRMSHARWMVHQIQDRAEKENWELQKLHRWLGFIQGIMWSTKLRGIEELREESKFDG